MAKNKGVKNILFIACDFPPHARGAGAVRTARTVRCLADFGYSCVVLTCCRKKSQGNNYLRLKMASETRVHDVRFFDPLRGIRHLIAPFFSLDIPDEMVWWIPRAVLAGKRLAGQEGVVAVFATGAPWSALVAGAIVSKLTGIPLIAEFRDPWTKNHFFKRGFLRKKLERIMEKAVLKTACGVIAVSELWKQALLSGFEKNERKFYCVTNGYDEEEFIGVNPGDNGKFTLCYFGSIYRVRECLEGLCRALARMMDEKKIEREKFECRIYGIYNPQVDNIVRDFGLEHIVRQYGLISHEESIRLQVRSTMLLLLLWRDDMIRGCYPAKLFEYLASGRPILALVPEGVSAELVRRCRAGYVIEPDDDRYITMRLCRCYEQWKNKQLHIQPDKEFIMRYERRNLVGQIALILESHV